MALVLLAVCISVGTKAQDFSIRLKLQDSNSGEPVAYAAVSLTKNGSKTVFKYAQTDGEGKVTLTGIPAGQYKIEGILLGYDNYSEQIDVTRNLDLGVKKMKVQANFLEGATVSDVGNPIIVKKDTIEHNVSLMKSGDNDVLEDLLKRLPGVEVDSDGKITANGKEINKIYVDGKEFFLNDPSLASKNLPAKIVDKVRVVEKKSEQAEFTGIDDGEEETVLDLGIKKGMMNGWFGNMMAGGGLDLLGKDAQNDARYQGAAMVARFSDKDQLAFIGNINNTNNRGFQDLAASSMGGMRVGGMRGGNQGIAKSYLAGLNGGHTFDNKSEIVGNALFNGNNRTVLEKTAQTMDQTDGTSQFSQEDSRNNTWTYGVRAGARADWKISKTTSLLFDPNFNIGWGGFDERTDFLTNSIDKAGLSSKVNEGYSLSTGDSHSQNASGRLLWRQRLGKPGRTISLNARYQFSNSDLTGFNNSLTDIFDETHQSDPSHSTVVDQMYDRNSRSQTASGRLSYTEPLGGNFYVEANYMYSYKLTDSYKNTYDKDASGNYTVLDETYSNATNNKFTNQNVGLNFRKQEEKYNITVGASYQPSKTDNHTQTGKYVRDTVLKTNNWSPNARIDINFSDSKMLRINYRGRNSQPGINQLMPVPDNSNPQSVQLGNLGLKPSFSHNVNMMYRGTNMNTFSSINASADFSYTSNGIVNARWTDSGVTYSVPVNSGEGTKNMSASIMYNTPIGKSKFSFMTFDRVGYNTGVSYVGKKGVIVEDEESYLDLKNYEKNAFQTLSAMINARITYRSSIWEASIAGHARYSQNWYELKDKNEKPSWTNSVDANVICNSDILGFKTDARYTFYLGYNQGFNTPTFVWNAEISKQIIKKQFTLALKVYDILNQSKNTYRSANNGMTVDRQNNTLGRYMVLSLTYRFGNFGGQRRGGMGPGGPMGGHGPMGGGRMGGGFRH